MGSDLVVPTKGLPSLFTALFLAGREGLYKGTGGEQGEDEGDKALMLSSFEGAKRSIRITSW